MAWIESHQTLGGHRKLRRLAVQLNICRPQAVGHLHYLWWWCLDNAPDGDLGDLLDGEIEDVSEWPPGRPGELAKALRDCGWLDGAMVHDWEVYAGRLIEIRERMKAGNAERQRRSRERNALRNGTVTRDVTPESRDGVTLCHGTESRPVTGLTGPDRTQPDQTERERARAQSVIPAVEPSEDPMEWEEFWIIAKDFIPPPGKWFAEDRFRAEAAKGGSQLKKPKHFAQRVCTWWRGEGSPAQPEPKQARSELMDYCP